MDLNHRPHAYQACALTSWATGPNDLIIICVLVILGLIGYITYDKLGLGNKPKTSSVKIEKEKDYDLEKAKKLIDKYYIEREDSNSFLDGMPDDVRNIIAIRNML